MISKPIILVLLVVMGFLAMHHQAEASAEGNQVEDLNLEDLEETQEETLVETPIETQKKERRRPGTCPAVPDGVFGTCAEECQYDVDCGRGQKCCSNGCGHTCVSKNRFVKPAKTKPGMCPRPDGNTFGTCAEECQNDMNCTGDAKCCSNGCGHTCMKPVSG